MSDVDPCHKIIEHLFLGSAQSLYMNIYFSLIVNCTIDIRIPKHFINYVRIPIDDSSEDCDKLLLFIKETNVLEKIYDMVSNKKDVLVHCYSGTQRSCALLACFLIKYYNKTPEEAIEFLKSKRNVSFFGGVHLLSAIEEFYNIQSINI
jgi:protein-tyrosine phosphatase